MMTPPEDARPGTDLPEQPKPSLQDRVLVGLWLALRLLVPIAAIWWLW